MAKPYTTQKKQLLRIVGSDENAFRIANVKMFSVLS